MRVLSTGRFSLLVVKGVMENEPQDWLLRLTCLSGGEHGLLATRKRERERHQKETRERRKEKETREKDRDIPEM